MRSSAALKKLSVAQGKLGSRLDELRPGASASTVKVALTGTQRALDSAQGAFRDRRDESEPIPDEAEIDAALGAEFDYLDAMRSTLTNFRSPLLPKLASRAQKAFDAFTALPDSEGVEEGIRGTQSFLVWARARSDGAR